MVTNSHTTNGASCQKVDERVERLLEAILSPDQARDSQRKFNREARKILAEVRQVYPEARVASGAPCDCGKVSDVDIYIPLDAFMGVEEEWTASYIRGAREVNILASTDPSRRRALAHRLVELKLMRLYPGAVDFVSDRKRGGVSTEEAWAEALGLEGDPYEAVAELAQPQKWVAFVASF